MEPPETTVVVDSEPESEDLFRAEEQPAPAVVDGAGKTPDPAPAPTPARVFVCSGLSRPLIRQVGRRRRWPSTPSAVHRWKHPHHFFVFFFCLDNLFLWTIALSKIVYPPFSIGYLIKLVLVRLG